MFVVLSKVFHIPGVLILISVSLLPTLFTKFLFLYFLMNVYRFSQGAGETSKNTPAKTGIMLYNEIKEAYRTTSSAI